MHHEVFMYTKFVCLCKCVCVCVCVHACMCVCMCVHVCVSVDGGTYTVKIISTGIGSDKKNI